jgi:hypothetical protein
MAVVVMALATGGRKVRVEYRSLETATHDPEVFKLQQVAALAAGAQDRMWNFIETFYHEQGRRRQFAGKQRRSYRYAVIPSRSIGRGAQEVRVRVDHGTRRIQRRDRRHTRPLTRHHR